MADRKMTSEMAVRAASWNPEDRTVDIVLTTDRPVRFRRYSWEKDRMEEYDEVLSMADGAIVRERLDSGRMPLLIDHDGRTSSVLGTFVAGTARVEPADGGRMALVAKARLSPVEEDKPTCERIISGILQNVSVGYQPTEYTDQERESGIPLRTVTRWEPYEGSIVGMGKDPSAHVRSLEIPPVTAPTAAPASAEGPEGAKTMDSETIAQAVAAENERVLTIQTTARNLKVDDDPAVSEMCKAGGPSLDAARARLIDLHAARSEKATPAVSALAKTGVQGVQVGTEDIEKFRGAMAEYFDYRYNGEALTEGARQFVGMTTLECARDLAIRGGDGARVKGVPRLELARRTLTTAHMPLLVAAVTGKSLNNGYKMSRTTYRRFSAKRPVPDFKLQRELYLDSFSDLIPPVGGEGGDYAQGTFAAGQETWQAIRRGRLLKLTPELLVNDDLGAFTRAFGKLGDAAARTEDKTFWALVVANSNMADGVPHYDALHGNVVAGGSGGAPSAAQIGLMRQLAWAQTDRSGEVIEVILTRYAIPAALEPTALQAWGINSPDSPTNVMPEEYRTERPTVVNRLDATSPAVWYGFEDPEIGADFVWGYLEGETGPSIQMETDFDSSCVKYKVEHYWGCGQVDHRHSVYNTGA